MKQNTSVFFIISFIALACGQLDGLTPEQSSDKLNLLKRQLEMRYRGGIPPTEPMRWFIENGEIIAQIEELDSTAALVYKDEQRDFFKKIQAKLRAMQKKPKAKQTKPKAMQQKPGVMQNNASIKKEIERENAAIADDIRKIKEDPNYSVNLEKIFNNITGRTGYIKKIKSIKQTGNNDLYSELGKLMGNILELLKIKKNNKQLSVYNFEKTARVIRSMYRTFIPASKKGGIPKLITMTSRTLSMMKKLLYDIYGARQAANNQLTVLYDFPWKIFGHSFSIRRRSGPQDDLLVKISPSFLKQEGWGKRLTRMAKEWYKSRFAGE